MPVTPDLAGIARGGADWHTWRVAADASSCVVYRVPRDGSVRRFSRDGLGFTLRFTADGLDFDFEPEAGRVLDTINGNVTAFAPDDPDPVFSAAGPVVVTDRLVLGCLNKPARTEIGDMAAQFVICDGEELLDEYILFAVKGHAVQRLMSGTKRHRLSSSVVMMQIVFPVDGADGIGKLELDRTDDKKGKFFQHLVRGVGTAHLRDASGEEDDSEHLLRILQGDASTLVAERNGIAYHTVDFSPHTAERQHTTPPAARR
jgi:hypothetical protein